ncbi:aromatic ring-opening dioxygenase LigA [Micromonospora sp. NPDC000442]|uniref:aromatic ring-opening dioxygenase LigA n=1 Tax=Micromonospora sp. NPDC000442 TaxID=3364217 RepID=UPI0036971DC7
MTKTTDASAVRSTTPGGVVRVLSVLVIVAGLVMSVAGGATWLTVQRQLADERITVSEDAKWFAGEKIDGPLTAYAEAEVIERHALEASGGRTYAELDREDPTRQVVMTGSFLRASLFTSVVSFGVAALAMGLGLILAIIGYVLLLVSRRLAALTPSATD